MEVFFEGWSSHWYYANKSFKNFFASDLDFDTFQAKIFFVEKGIHKLVSCRLYIDNYKTIAVEWHYAIECIILDSWKVFGILLDAMNYINKHLKPLYFRCLLK
jgi:hypothetical protein